MICAGSFLVTAGKDEYMMSDPVEKRRTAPSLPAATAGTVEAARRVANNTIANIINLAATGSQPVDTKMDCDIPAIPGTSRGFTGCAAGGANAPVAARHPAGGYDRYFWYQCCLQESPTGSRRFLLQEDRHVRGDHGAAQDQGGACRTGAGPRGRHVRLWQLLLHGG